MVIITIAWSALQLTIILGHNLKSMIYNFFVVLAVAVFFSILGFRFQLSHRITFIRHTYLARSVGLCFPSSRWLSVWWRKSYKNKTTTILRWPNRWTQQQRFFFFFWFLTWVYDISVIVDVVVTTTARHHAISLLLGQSFHWISLFFVCLPLFFIFSEYNDKYTGENKSFVDLVRLAS